MNTPIAITAIIAGLLLANAIVTALRDVATAKHGSATKYPHQDGDLTVLGPETFTNNTHDVICWKGVNYMRKEQQ